MICIPSDSRLKQSKILIIEDDRINSQLLAHHLNQEGYSAVSCAMDGLDGLELMEINVPDLIILDIIMPNMDGLEFIKRVRATPRFENIPIIFQTILNEMDYKLRAFDMGATDYISKPLNKAELSARIRVHLLNKILIEDLLARQDVMQNELVAARDMQDKLMPSPEQIQRKQRQYHMEIANYFETSSILGGDCWGLRRLDEKRLAIFMFDLSGHGVGAALNVFRLHAMMQDLAADSHNASLFMSKLNAAAYKLFARHEFASMFYGVIDTEANSLQYAAASSPPIMLFNPMQLDPIVLSGRGYPLGAISDATFESHYVPFMSGDTLLLFSDCLVETTNKNGEMLQESQIAQCVSQALMNGGESPAENALTALRVLFDTHHDYAPLRDDLTINIYRRR